MRPKLARFNKSFDLTPLHESLMRLLKLVTDEIFEARNDWRLASTEFCFTHFCLNSKTFIKGQSKLKTIQLHILNNPVVQILLSFTV